MATTGRKLSPDQEIGEGALEDGEDAFVEEFDVDPTPRLPCGVPLLTTGRWPPEPKRDEGPPLQRKSVKLPPRPVPADSESRWDAVHYFLIERAVKVAVEGGFRELSFGKLGARARVSKAHVVEHFGSRANLDAQIADYCARRVMEQVEGAAHWGGGGLLSLFRAAEALLHTAQWDTGIFLEMVWIASGKASTPAREIVEEHRAHVRERLRGCAMRARTLGELDRYADVDQLVFELIACASVSSLHHEDVVRAHGVIRARCRFLSPRSLSLPGG